MSATPTTVTRPSTAVNVTFDSLPDSGFNVQLPRASSVGNNLYAHGGYSVSASARTSYTRVDESLDDDQGVSVIPNSSHPQLEDTPEAEAESSIPHTPQIALTFLLISGRRRSMTFDPTHNVGRVKELVWNTWPGDWQDERPPAPSFLRVLYRGRILQDDDILKDIPFPVDAPATIVHMSIRPGAVEDDVHKKAAEEERSVCCCLIS